MCRACRSLIFLSLVFLIKFLYLRSVLSSEAEWANVLRVPTANVVAQACTGYSSTSAEQNLLPTGWGAPPLHPGGAQFFK